MGMFSGPTEHAENPPETWLVRKAGDRLWELTTKSGTVINTYGTQTHAREERTPGHFFADLYAKETRWYAGEQIEQWKPWATVKAEREATVRRLADRGRSGLEGKIDRWTRWLRTDFRSVSKDPMPEDIVEWARWYAKTYPGPVGQGIAVTLAQIDDARAELARTDGLVADHAAA